MLRFEDVRESATQDPVRERNGSGDGEEFVELLTAHVTEIASLVKRLARIQALRWRLGVTRALLLGVAGAVAALTSAAVALAAVWLVVTGLTAGLTVALEGRRWLAELCAGTLLLGGLALFFVALRSAAERVVVRALEQRDANSAKN